MCPVSPEQWQQRAVATTQTAQAMGTTRGAGVCANQALARNHMHAELQMHVLVPKRQTWEHVSHGHHQPDGVPAVPCRRRAGLTNQAAE